MNLNTKEKAVVTLVDLRLANRKKGKILRNKVLLKSLMVTMQEMLLNFDFRGK